MRFPVQNQSKVQVLKNISSRWHSASTTAFQIRRSRMSRAISDKSHPCPSNDWGTGRSWANETTPGGVRITSAAKETSNPSLHPIIKTNKLAARRLGHAGFTRRAVSGVERSGWTKRYGALQAPKQCTLPVQAP
jgi:hypothetical protein